MSLEKNKNTVEHVTTQQRTMKPPLIDIINLPWAERHQYRHEIHAATKELQTVLGFPDLPPGAVLAGYGVRGNTRYQFHGWIVINREKTEWTGGWEWDGTSPAILYARPLSYLLPNDMPDEGEWEDWRLGEERHEDDDYYCNSDTGWEWKEGKKISKSKLSSTFFTRRKQSARTDPPEAKWPKWPGHRAVSQGWGYNSKGNKVKHAIFYEGEWSVWDCGTYSCNGCKNCFYVEFIPLTREERLEKVKQAVSEAVSYVRWSCRGVAEAAIAAWEEGQP